MIYHIIERSDFEAIGDTGIYHPESLDREGFIHCSADEESVVTVANNFYRHRDILVLVIDEGCLGEGLRWERPTHDIFEKPFPHLYGELDMKAVRGIQLLETDDRGLRKGFRNMVDSETSGHDIDIRRNN
ncbi:MAG: DUF952 domain-containing protein [Spirochaetes bacterium]|nr:DUF952 domain-containing protein [Spirochaetota bacterium]